MSSDHHSKYRQDSVRCAVVTISDTRTPENDKSGSLIAELLAGAGHSATARQIVPDDPARISECILQCCDDETCQAILLTGGTGIAPRDQTIEAVEPLLEKKLDGFGELFRMLSYQEIGAAAMLSRALAGTRGRTVVFAMPGSPNAVRLAMEKLILPQLGHLAALLNS